MLLHHFLLSECRPGPFPAGFSIFRVKCCRTVNPGRLGIATTFNSAKTVLSTNKWKYYLTTTTSFMVQFPDWLLDNREIDGTQLGTNAFSLSFFKESRPSVLFTVNAQPTMRADRSFNLALSA